MSEDVKAPAGEVEMLVLELVGIVEQYGSSNKFHHTPGLKMAIDRPDLIGRSARITWGATMKNPESVSLTPADVKARANQIMDRLDQIQAEAPPPPPAKKRD